jgi:hypothetical protein
VTITQATRRLSALHEKLTQEATTYISKGHFFGRMLYDLQQYMGPQNFRKVLFFSAARSLMTACEARGEKPTKQEISDAAATLIRNIQEFIAITFDPDIESRVDPSLTKIFLNEWEKQDLSIPFIDDFNTRLKEQQIDVKLHEIELGERLIALRNELGNQTVFEKVLARRCPSIPLDDAEQFMRGARESPLACILHQDDNDDCSTATE